MREGTILKVGCLMIAIGCSQETTVQKPQSAATGGCERWAKAAAA